MDKKPITDFGEKIGGARKDIRGTMTPDDILAMTTDERMKLVNKGVIWPTPNYAEMVSSGDYTQKSAAMIKMVRDALPPMPAYSPKATEEEIKQTSIDYLEVVAMVKKVVSVTGDEVALSKAVLNSEVAQTEIGTLVPSIYSGGRGFSFSPSAKMAERSRGFGGQHGLRSVQFEIGRALASVAEGRLTATMSRAIQRNPKWPETVSRADTLIKKSNVRMRLAKGGYTIHHYSRMGDDIKPRLAELGFAELSGQFFEDVEAANAALKTQAEGILTKESAAKKQKRERLRLEALGVVDTDGQQKSRERVGVDYRHGVDAEGEDFLNHFGLRAGEFGNWVDQKERQDLLNRGFDGFADIATAYNVPPATISLEGTMAIAFGARGRGGWAAAHYEPGRKAMNLTKPNGAGAQCHEWGHGLDHWLGNKAREMNLVESLVDVQDMAGISNMVLKNAVPGQEMTESEKVLREFHALAKSIHTNTGPVTKQEVQLRQTKSLDIHQDLLGRYIGYPMKNSGTPESANKISELYVEICESPLEGREEVLCANIPKIVELGKLRGTPRGDHEVARLEALQLEIGRGIRSLGETLALPDNWQTPGRQRPTELHERCKKLDQERSSPYYATPVEMFARAFEAATVDLLDERGYNNEFLVSGSKGSAFPHGHERVNITGKFSNLMSRVPALMPAMPQTHVDFTQRALEVKNHELAMTVMTNASPDLMRTFSKEQEAAAPLPSPEPESPLTPIPVEAIPAPVEPPQPMRKFPPPPIRGQQLDLFS